MTIASSGVISIPGNMTVGGGITVTGGGSDITLPNGSNQILWSARTRLTSPSDGLLLLRNTATTGFDRLQLGGITELYPAIRRNGADLDIVRADQGNLSSTPLSGYANLRVATVQTGGYTFATLPTSATQGMRAYITDGVPAPIFMGTAASGGTTVTPVFYNGTNWINC
jgi:hypothetical protein